MVAERESLDTSVAGPMALEGKKTKGRMFMNPRKCEFSKKGTRCPRPPRPCESDVTEEEEEVKPLRALPGLPDPLIKETGFEIRGLNHTVARVETPRMRGTTCTRGTTQMKDARKFEGIMSEKGKAPKGASQSSQMEIAQALSHKYLDRRRDRRQSVSEPPRSARASEMTAPLIRASRGSTSIFSSEISKNSFCASCHILVVCSHSFYTWTTCARKKFFAAPDPRLLLFSVSLLL